MSSSNFYTLRPIAEFNGLPRLETPNFSKNGRIIKQDNTTKFTYNPSDHPKFTENFGNENYEDDEMLYTVNSRFFRADEFDKSDPGVMFLGCSHTYGIGLRDAETWPHQVSDALNLPNWNLGSGGSGVDYCYYVAKQFIEEGYIPKAVCVMWPSIWRKILINDRPHGIDNIMNAVINDQKHVIATTWLPGHYQYPGFETLSKLMSAFSRTQRYLEFLEYRDLLYYLCKSHSVNIIEMLPQELELHEFEYLLNQDKKILTIPYRLNSLSSEKYYLDAPWGEFCRDGVHWCAEVHEILAKLFVDHIG